MTYTAIGVWLDDKPVVVGVVVGDHEVYGGDDEQFPDGLWATTVDAEDVAAAETLARAEITENNW